MITTADFKKQIAKPFGQEMRRYNFKGTGFEYFQETDDLLIAVYISPGRWGGRCSAGFAIHPKQIDKDYYGKLDLAKLKIYHYEFRMGLTDYPRGKSWDYANDENANLETLSKIIATIKEKAFPVIDQFKATPNFLEKFDVNEMEGFYKNWTNRTGVYVVTTDIRFAWVMTLFFENKNLDKAKQFATWGLLNLEDGIKPWFGKEDFERVLATKNGLQQRRLQ